MVKTATSRRPDLKMEGALIASVTGKQDTAEGFTRIHLDAEGYHGPVILELPFLVELRIKDKIHFYPDSIERKEGGIIDNESYEQVVLHMADYSRRIAFSSLDIRLLSETRR